MVTHGNRLGLLLLALILLAPSSIKGDETTVRLATATSTENAGLLQRLLPPFERRTGYRVHVIATGTGKALRLARDGNVDVVLVHAYEDELKLVADGYGVNRRDVMYNDFVIVGPLDDPARIRGLQDAADALRRIAASQTSFLSRGDDSGTHKKERALWQAAGVRPSGSWYREVGQGQGRTLQMARELQAYVLTDRGTWIAHQRIMPILVEGDARLYNRYGVISVNPARHVDVNYMGAMRLIGWLTGVRGQAIIRDYRIAGEPLFFPLALAP
ncbi:MAG: substrate-binding domain-containing protein [Gammaproteobacteria bacterium]|jgi:tungstate transport system substrate-binding protein|nr:substrate-binding domain-containing protein [Gammaproteobacteria bacterium]